MCDFNVWYGSLIFLATIGGIAIGMMVATMIWEIDGH